MTVDEKNQVHFGRDILGLFALVGIFAFLYGIQILLHDAGISTADLAPMRTLTATLGTSAGLYATYIVGHVIVSTRKDNQ